MRLRIRSLFTWAKSEVSGFDDLSPLDQKALLRRTVPELVMLGFARGSIAYNGGLGAVWAYNGGLGLLGILSLKKKSYSDHNVIVV